ncbi:GyrI-like domain-containing protein [candidate division KSB1 bacterium]|nr:GyrI-like domain-containing protein [candidate division KSB1 bacterium]
MKKAVLIIIVIAAFCMTGLAFAQEVKKSDTVKPSEGVDEPSLEKSDKPSPQKTDESSLQKSGVTTAQNVVMSGDVIKVIDVEPFTYCAVEMTGSYDQHDTAFNTLYEQAGIQSLPQTEIPFGIYKSDPAQTPEEELKWELGFALPDSSQVTEPLKMKKWEFTQIVSRMYDGVFSEEEMGQVYGEIYEWIGQNNYTPAGPLMEKYMSQPEQNADGEWTGTVEIWVPVQKAQ